jgi:anthranilate phosphoribosyltransferase
MRHAGPTRKEIGLRTAFNLLGPLTNPARPTRQLVGVPRPELTQLLARSLQLLGAERAWVVHGADGIDEISTTGHTKVSECRDGAVHTFFIHPTEFGIRKAALAELLGGDAAENAAIVRRVLEGNPGAPRDAVVLNAGAALFVAGRVESVREGIRVAADGIDSGAALATLATMVQASRAEAVA